MKKEPSLSQKKKNSVALITTHSWVGVSTSVINTALYLVGKGYEVDLFICELENIPEHSVYSLPQFKQNNIKIYSSREICNRNLPLKIKSPGAGKKTGGIMPYLKSLKNRFFPVEKDLKFVARYIKPPGKYLFIIGYEPSGLLRAGILSRIWRTPYVYHSLEIYENHETNIKSLEKWFSRRALLSLTQDEIRADILSLLNGLNRTKVTAAYNSPLGDRIYEKDNYFREKFNISEEKKIVMATGSLLVEHSADKIVRSVAKWPENFVLILHGWITSSPITDAGKMTELIRKEMNSKSDRIILSTEILPSGDKYRVFKSVDIGLVFFEPVNLNMKYAAGSAGKLYDFMRTGVPIIAGELPGMRDLLEGNKCGIVVESADNIGEALPEIMKNYSFYSENAHKSYDKYEFSKCYEKILERILKEI